MPGIFRRYWRAPPPSQILPAGVNVSPVNADLIVTEADDAAAATATLDLQGSLATTEGDDFATADGALLITASSFPIEDDDVAVATGTLGIVANATAAEADDIPSAAGTIDIVGSVVLTEADDSIAAGAENGIAANVVITEEDDTIAFTALMPIWYPRRGGVDEQQEFERRQEEWQKDLRRVLDEAWLIAAGIIDPVTRQVIPLPDYSPVIQGMLDQALAVDQARTEAFRAEEARQQEGDAIAVLLLAA